jgi:hypothetical protein
MHLELIERIMQGLLVFGQLSDSAWEIQRRVARIPALWRAPIERAFSADTFDSRTATSIRSSIALW